MRILMLALLLSGCAQFGEQREAQQDAELRNNLAEVEFCHREICRQIRADTVQTYYGDDLAGWRAFCQ